MPVGNDNASAFAHLEQRVSYLLERIEASDRPAPRPPQISAGSRTGCRTSCALSKASTPIWSRSSDSSRNRADAPHAMDPGLVDSSSANCPTSASASRKPTAAPRTALETVHNTLGHVVDRLAMIEGDLRERSRRAAWRRCRARPRYRSTCAMKPPRAAMPSQAFVPPPFMQPLAPKPELPNPAAASEFCARCRSTSSPRRANSTPPSRSSPPPIPPSTPRAISEILVPHAAAPRAAIEPELPPDHPLEPGTRPTGADGPRRRSASPRPRARSAKSRPAPKSRSVRRASSPPRAAPRRPPPPRRRPRRPAAAAKAAAKDKGRRSKIKAGAKDALAPKARASPRRSARCWSARAWS